MEDKALICKAICDALRTTSAAGNPDNNPLVELRYIKDEDGEETVRPIFADGTGKNGYYDINVSGDSGIGMWIDITYQFIRNMW